MILKRVPTTPLYYYTGRTHKTMNEANIILQDLSETWLCPDPDVRLSVLRLDLIHPVISGNKWFKLKYNLAAAQDKGFNRVLTFGGAFSNHLIATAAAAAQAGLKSLGIVRGLHGKAQETPTLGHCREYGMELLFVSRADYARKEEAIFQQQILAQTGPAFIIPEGGQNEWGRKGAAAIAAFIPETATHVCVSVGSGTTFFGLRNALPKHQCLLGFAPFKNGENMEAALAPLMPHSDQWRITGAWHFGGFAKTNQALNDFMDKAQMEADLPLDRVYTAKMFFGIREWLLQAYFPKGANIVAIHTGGLQGNNAF